MPSLIYAPVNSTRATSHVSQWHMLTMPLGVRTAHVRDGSLCDDHHSATSQDQACCIHFHIREPADSQAAIWIEGGQILKVFGNHV